MKCVYAICQAHGRRQRHTRIYFNRIRMRWLPLTTTTQEKTEKGEKEKKKQINREALVFVSQNWNCLSAAAFIFSSVSCFSIFVEFEIRLIKFLICLFMFSSFDWTVFVSSSFIRFSVISIGLFLRLFMHVDPKNHYTSD